MISISKIAESINGQIEGNSDLLIEDICELKGGTTNCISFIAHDKYSDLYINSQSDAVIVGMSINLPESTKTIIRVDNPPLAFNKVAELFRPKPPIQNGIHVTAVISSTASVGEMFQSDPM